MSNFVRDGSEGGWQEDYQRIKREDRRDDHEHERRVGRVTQEAHAAICRSYEGEGARARERIEIALDYWERDDRVRELLLAARQHYLVGDVCRRYLREAAQLLLAECDPQVTFERGGAHR